MDDMECQYCGADQEVNHDDGQGYEEGVFHQHECSECEKIFVFQTSIMFHYSPSKADCLNEGEHEYKPVTHYPRHWPDWIRCINCWYEIKGDFVKNVN